MQKFDFFKIILRKNLKKRAIALFGGKCVLCGYDKCVEALEFHHLDPEQKDISISSMYASPQSWQKVVSELKKCALLCANCHREVHYNKISIEHRDYIILDEVDYRLTESDNYHKCVCGNVIRKSDKHCSLSCRARNKQLYNWEEEKNNIFTENEKLK